MSPVDVPRVDGHEHHDPDTLDDEPYDPTHHHGEPAKPAITDHRNTDAAAEADDRTGKATGRRSDTADDDPPPF